MSIATASESFDGRMLSLRQLSHTEISLRSSKWFPFENQLKQECDLKQHRTNKFHKLAVAWHQHLEMKEILAGVPCRGGNNGFKGAANALNFYNNLPSVHEWLLAFSMIKGLGSVVARMRRSEDRKLPQIAQHHRIARGMFLKMTSCLFQVWRENMSLRLHKCKDISTKADGKGSCERVPFSAVGRESLGRIDGCFACFGGKLGGAKALVMGNVA